MRKSYIEPSAETIRIGLLEDFLSTSYNRGEDDEQNDIEQDFNQGTSTEGNVEIGSGGVG